MSKEFVYQIHDCHALLIEAILKIVNQFFNDPILQERLSLNDKVLNLLYLLKDQPYEIGAIRPDFLFTEHYQLKICEINARFPLNAFLLSQCLYTEIHKNYKGHDAFFSDPLFNVSQTFQGFFDSSQPIVLLLDKEKSFVIFLYQNILKKTAGLKFKIITPRAVQQNKPFFQMILNLHQDELVSLQPDFFKKIVERNYFNDLRTIFIVHDKRLSSILSNKEIMSKYLSSEKCNRLVNYIIPTYSLKDKSILHNISVHPQNWVLKKVSVRKGEGMYIGKEAQLTEILTVLNEKKDDYIAQPFIK